MWYVGHLHLFSAPLCDLSSLLYVFKWTWSSKSLQNGPKSAREYPSETAPHLPNTQQLSTQWLGPSILILMKPAVFFFPIGASREAFGSKMCLLATYRAKCQFGIVSQWSRPWRPWNKWPSTLILIMTEPGMVYLEIRVCSWGFWWQNMVGLYFSLLLSSWNQMS